MLIDDKHRLHRDRYLFVSSRIDATSTIAVQLQHTTLSKCLTKTCKRTGIFQTEEEVFRRMTCSRIRFSVIMELVSLDEDNLDNIAFCFGKHSKEVCKKSYVQFWSTRAAARLSWKCHQIYNTDKEKKAVELRENILENKTIPEVDDIETWISNRINVLKLPGTEVQDPGLIDLVKRFKAELHFRKINGKYNLNFGHVFGTLKS